MSRPIRLTRSSRKEPYGFEIKTTKQDSKHVAFNVTPDSIADKAGLRNGDYILEVNDESVSGLWHDAVLMKMAMYSRRLDLLVVNDLPAFIRSRRSSFIARDLPNDYEDGTKSVVSSRTDLSSRQNRTIGRLNIDNLNHNDRISVVSKSYREPVNKNHAIPYRTHSSDPLELTENHKVTSTPKLSAKTKTKVMKPLIKFIGSSRFNQLVNIAEAKSKLDEYGKKIRLKRHETNSELNYYGFNFRLSKEGQHVVTNTIPDYPAYEAGIRDGNYILEVNGDIITGLSHHQVVKKILSNSIHVDLLIVTDLDAYLNARQLLSQIKDERSSDQDSNRYYIKKSAQTNLGLNVISNGIIGSVEPFTPAEKAGLRKGLKIVKINDISLNEKTDHQIKKLIKDNENYLVIDAFKIYDNYKATLYTLPNVNDDYDDSDVFSNNQSRVSGRNQSNHISPNRAKSVETINDINDTLDSTNDSLSNNNDYSVTRVHQQNYSYTNKQVEKTKHLVKNSIKTTHDNEIYSNEPYLNHKITPSYTNESKTYHEIDNIIGSRVITMIPRPDYDGFGFELMYDNKNNGPAEIANVVVNSPAFNAGLRDNDLVLKVDDENVAQEQYSNIVNLFRDRSSRGPLKIEVIDKNIYRSMTRPASPKTDSMPINTYIKNFKAENRFKRCYLKLLTNFDGFGITITPHLKPKYSIYEVNLDSPAYLANLRKYDVIIEVDKINIRRFKFEDVYRLMQNGCVNRQIEILAISREGYDYYKDRNKRFSSKKLVRIENTDLYST